MTIDYLAAYEVVKVVLNNHEGCNTISSSGICGLITGITTLGACAFLGPLGIYVGALLGSTVAYTAFKNKFKSLFQVVDEDFTEEEKQILTKNVKKFAEELNISDIASLVALMSGNVLMEQQLFNILKLCIHDVLKEKLN